jgi:hypothetical protein
MLLLAYLLTKNDAWRGRSIRVQRVIEKEAGRADVERHLTELISSARIRAVPVVVVASDAEEAIQRTSRWAAMVFMGFEAPEEGEERTFVDRMERLAGPLPRVAFVDSSGGMSLET